ncbi:MAG: hypothetical protein VR73_16180 [Gammaproteobacteria bacterium BRH_c0]|nr:MAG: hypothetical protein VR73_16180 [Gammaproteobacteria bacterium BRH_c0]
MNSVEHSQPAIIELVDSEILATASDGEQLSSPGYALLEKSGIATGASAFDQAWLYPQRSFNQFWHQLNLAPLPVSSAYARHFADLAFAQLSHIHRELGQPAEVLFALPGSFSRDQLSILLGLANALQIKTLGLVDSAVAAASTLEDLSGELLHVDIQLHQAVITRLSATDSITRLGVEIVPDAGLKAFHSAWAQQIANQFIHEYRYDPLHTAQGEQQLFSKLPVWLRQLATSSETAVELQTPRGNFRLNLQRSALLDSSSARWGKLRELLTRMGSNSPVIASYRLHALAGIDAQLNARILDRQQVIGACRTALPQLAAQGNQLEFVTRLARRQSAHTTPPSKADNTTTAATHLLYGHSAVPVATGLAIDIDGPALGLHRGASGKLLLEVRNQQLVLTGERQDVKVEGNPDDLRAGDRLVINGVTLTLIQALDEVPTGA